MKLLDTQKYKYEIHLAPDPRGTQSTESKCASSCKKLTHDFNFFWGDATNKKHYYFQKYNSLIPPK